MRESAPLTDFLAENLVPSAATRPGWLSPDFVGTRFDSFPDRATQKPKHIRVWALHCMRAMRESVTLVDLFHKSHSFDPTRNDRTKVRLRHSSVRFHITVKTKSPNALHPNLLFYAGDEGIEPPTKVLETFIIPIN